MSSPRQGGVGGVYSLARIKQNKTEGRTCCVEIPTSIPTRYDIPGIVFFISDLVATVTAPLALLLFVFFFFGDRWLGNILYMWLLS